MFASGFIACFSRRRFFGRGGGGKQAIARKPVLLVWEVPDLFRIGHGEDHGRGPAVRNFTALDEFTRRPGRHGSLYMQHLRWVHAVMSFGRWR